MLSKLKLQGKYRSLSANTFDQDAIFGKRTVIYGHNGSGKSSFAEMLHELSRGQFPEKLTWWNEDGRSSTILPGNLPEGGLISVYTRTWIKDNLSSFLEGDEAKSIAVNLGAKSVEGATEQKKLEKSLKKLYAKEPVIEKELEIARKATKALVKSVQDSITGTLGPIDNSTFTKSRYNDPRVRSLLTDAVQDYIDDAKRSAFLDELKEDPLPEISYPGATIPECERMVDNVRQLLNRSTQSQVIENLIGNGELQSWLAKGLELHQAESTCLFCESNFGEDRHTELRRHFDDSRKQLQAEIDQELAVVSAVRNRVESWRDGLPERSALFEELRTEFDSVIQVEQENVSSMLEFLDELKDVLDIKRETPEKANCEEIGEPPRIAGELLEEILLRHNEISSEAGERRKSMTQQILEAIVGSQCSAYQDFVDSEADAVKKCELIRDSIREESLRLSEAKAKQYSSHEMASKITYDLSSIYGKKHLSIEVSADGRAYLCRRDGEAATHLSEGERNTLALVYFLRSLEDESVEVPAHSRLVVIDDPSSSFDRETVFATHSWLLDILGRYGQSIILTHDFEMLRLLLHSQNNQMRKHLGIIQGFQSEDSSKVVAAREEARYPRIAFLEMTAGPGDAYRRSSGLRRISRYFIDHKSEYHYLFVQVATGVSTGEADDSIFLIPNAARRLLESFVSFHAPEITDFLGQLKKLAVDDRGGEYRDVYDFCNRFSHGEGRELQQSLDLRSTLQSVRRSLEFIKAVDENHYLSMCRATGWGSLDPLVLDSDAKI